MAKVRALINTRLQESVGRRVSEPRAVATGSCDTLENIRCPTQLRLDPVAIARGSDTIAENTSATNFATDSFSRVIGISRNGGLSGPTPGLAQRRC